MLVEDQRPTPFHEEIQRISQAYEREIDFKISEQAEARRLILAAQIKDPEMCEDQINQHIDEIPFALTSELEIGQSGFVVPWVLKVTTQGDVVLTDSPISPCKSGQVSMKVLRGKDGWVIYIPMNYDWEKLHKYPSLPLGGMLPVVQTELLPGTPSPLPTLGPPTITRQP